MIICIKINSFKEYVEYIEKYKGSHLFRGQCNINWKIEPSIFRNDELIKKEGADIKSKDYYDENNIIESIFKMQHYSCKTRLLDLTNSPLSALFFACDGDNDSKEDGVVYVIPTNDAILYEKTKFDFFASCVINENIEDCTFSNDELELLTNDTVVVYDERLAYSNERAMLQGGTIALIGFGRNGNKVTRYKKVDFASNAIVKIRIPSHLKQEMIKKLKEKGFFKEILYKDVSVKFYEGSRILIEKDILQQEIEVKPVGVSNKVIAYYNLMHLDFTRSSLENLIQKEYESLFFKYGKSARIWLFFYYDKEDYDNDNFICRTSWSESNPCIITWVNDYYVNRNCKINEQFTNFAVTLKLKKIFDKAELFERVLVNEYEKNGLNEFIKIANEKNELIENLRIDAENIPWGSNTQDLRDKVINYIYQIEYLSKNILDFYNKNKREQFINYKIKEYIADCNKAKKGILLKIFKKYKLKRIR